MSLSVGIVGLPNVGKSTLFNALASRRLAETAPRLFTTIDPNEAVVAVPDENLEKLWGLIQGDPSTAPAERGSLRMTERVEIVPTSVTFIDIAGLVKNAHKGEGLGNQFLAKIREVDAIVHVVRSFSDVNVSHSHLSHEMGSEKQIIEDIEIINLELELGDIEKKPTIYVLNVSEESITSTMGTTSITSLKKIIKNNPSIQICAKLEEELIDFDENERKEYMQTLGIRQEALDKLIKSAYEMLDLITFYTIKPSSAKAAEGRGGGTIVSAWSLPAQTGLKKGSNALQAAEKVHTDFAKKFIKAEVILVDRLLEIGNWKKAKEKGEIRLEGKDYIVQDKDVIEFKIGA